MDTKILLVEDDTMLNEGIAYALRKGISGYTAQKNIEEASGYESAGKSGNSGHQPAGWDGRMF